MVPASFNMGAEGRRVESKAKDQDLPFEAPPAEVLTHMLCLSVGEGSRQNEVEATQAQASQTL